MSIVLFALAALAQASQSAGPLVLNLDCTGGGERTVHGTSTGLVHGSNGWTTGTVVTRHMRDFNDMVSVRLDGDKSTIRLPRRMLPRAHGGKDGWFELADVKVSDTDITGTAHVNFANHPKVRIDRMAGTISVDGKIGSFVGSCQAFDPATTQRAF